MTDRMWAILEHLATLEGYDSETPNEIGYAVGVQPIGGAQYRSRGPGSIISSQIQGLERRGLVHYSARRDGMSGTAYRITDLGRAAVTARLVWEDERADGPGVYSYTLQCRRIRGEGSIWSVFVYRHGEFHSEIHPPDQVTKAHAMRRAQEHAIEVAAHASD